MKYAVTTAPSTEPISLAEAKLHLRTITGDTTEDTAILTPLISAAREYCENITGRAIAKQTVKAYPEKFESVMDLPRAPIRSITAIKYVDENNTTTTMDAADYALDGEYGRLAILTIPSFTPRALNPIEIEYEAGYTTTPKLIRQAMLLLIGHWYINREAVATGAVTTVEIDMTTRALLRQYKDWWF